MARNSEPRVWNHTPYELAEIPTMFAKITEYRNEWRKRNVHLYRIGPDQLVSIGRCDNGDTVVAVESDQDHARALDAAAFCRAFVAE